MSTRQIQRAIEMLTEQREQLKALRNANVRDKGFKQWRQATLTIVQRLWPGDTNRSDRFRRVPFSPPSTQAQAREIREFYERGCAEAAALILELIQDVKANGLPKGDGQGAPPKLRPEDLAGDSPPRVDLPEDVIGGTGDKGVSDTRLSKARDGRLRDMLGLESLETDEDGFEEAGDDPPSPEDQEVKLIEGFEEEDASDPEDAPALAADAPAEPDVREPKQTRPKGSARTSRAKSSPARDTERLFPAEAEEVESDIESETEEPIDDLLGDSPIFRSPARPPRRSRREDPEESAPLESAAAVAIAAIATDIDRLGVPRGQRSRTRAALIDLATLLDAGELSWEGLRGAVTFVMEYPALGRRVLPLLIPFLDRAA